MEEETDHDDSISGAEDDNIDDEEYVEESPSPADDGAVSSRTRNGGVVPKSSTNVCRYRYLYTIDPIRARHCGVAIPWYKVVH